LGPPTKIEKEADKWSEFPSRFQVHLCSVAANCIGGLAWCLPECH
jgi:hypothetical protein